MAFDSKYLKIHDVDDVRIVGTRIGLEHLLSAHLDDGFSAEQLVEQFPSLNLEQVRGVLTYYDENRDEVDAYLERWRKGCQERYEAWLRQPQPEVVLRIRRILEEQRKSASMKANVFASICGAANCWKVATASDPPAQVKQRKVSLQIQGDAVNGYHLIMSPDGCFTADSWHSTLDDALDTAQRLFGVGADKWSQLRDKS